MKFICIKYPKIEMTVSPDVKKEINGEIIKTPRHVIKFENGYYETEDPKEIEFIKKHVDFNNDNIVIDESSVLQKKEVVSDVSHEVSHTEKVKRGRPKKVE